MDANYSLENEMNDMVEFVYHFSQKLFIFKSRIGFTEYRQNKIINELQTTLEKTCGTLSNALNCHNSYFYLESEQNMALTNQSLKSEIKEKKQKIDELYTQIEKNSNKISQLEELLKTKDDDTQKLLLEKETQYKNELIKKEDEYRNELIKKEDEYRNELIKKEDEYRNELIEKELKYKKFIDDEDSGEEKQLDIEGTPVDIEVVQSDKIPEISTKTFVEKVKSNINNNITNTINNALPKQLKNNNFQLLEKKKNKKPLNILGADKINSMSIEELSKISISSISKEDIYVSSKFHLKNGMVVNKMDDYNDMEFYFKDPKYFGGDDSIYEFIGMCVCTNGFLYKYDEEKDIFYLATYKGKFQMWRNNK